MRNNIICKSVNLNISECMLHAFEYTYIHVKGNYTYSLMLVIQITRITDITLSYNIVTSSQF